MTPTEFGLSQLLLFQSEGRIYFGWSELSLLLYYFSRVLLERQILKLRAWWEEILPAPCARSSRVKTNNSTKNNFGMVAIKLLYRNVINFDTRDSQDESTHIDWF